jgi:2-oxoglutarate ferredoxin oxidoreductase subunit alpha
MLLTDGYLANAAEPWRIPNVDEIKPFPVKFRTDPEGFHPYLRDPKTLARVWAIPGTPGLEHRIGGIEKDYDTGDISYEPDNHHRMTMVRVNRIKRIAEDLPDQAVALGNTKGKLAVVGWGSTYGAINQAVRRCREAGLDVSHIHIRHIWPMPKNMGQLLGSFERVLVPEMNAGQLRTVLRAEYLVDAKSLNQISGQPFKVVDLEAAIRNMLEKGEPQ